MDQISFGKIFTHLTEKIVNKLIVEFQTKNSDHIPRIIQTINEDKVYKSISAGLFRTPVSNCQKINKLKNRLDELLCIAEHVGLENKGQKKYLENVENNIRKFIRGRRKNWDDKSYFIIPVITKNMRTNKRNSGMLYLKADPRLPGNSCRKPAIGSLTEDLNIDRYFEQIFNLLMETFYQVEAYPFEEFPGQYEHSYELFFQAQISDAKSMGAGILAIFSIAFIKKMFGMNYSTVISPECGTALTGEIGYDGKILPVDNIKEKIACVYNEYGPQIKMIFPAANLGDIPKNFRKKNLFFVNNIEELLSTVLSSHGLDLNNLRSSLFQKLTQSQKIRLKSRIKKGISQKAYDFFLESGNLITQNNYKKTIFYTSKAWNNQIEAIISVDPVILNDAKERILIIIDGSESMSKFFEKDDDNICKISKVINEFVINFDPKTQDIAIGFLSCTEINPVQSISDELNHVRPKLREIEKFLQDIRATLKLHYRGSFFRPVRESIEKETSSKKIIYVISDSYLPDIKDTPMSLKRLFVQPEPSDQKNNINDILFENDRMNKSIIENFFTNKASLIKNLTIHFGNQMPVEWNPVSGKLKEINDDFSITWNNINDRNIGIQCRILYPYMHLLKVNGIYQEIVKNGKTKDVDFNFEMYSKVSKIEPFSSTQNGKLEAMELSIWNVISSPTEKCPICDRYDIHITHEDELQFLKNIIIFESLSALNKGFLILEAHRPEWHFFQVGCQVKNVLIIRIENELKYINARGNIETIPIKNNVYHLELETKNFYIFEIN